MSGKKIGYIRVSSVDQNPERQLDGIELDKKFIDYASGSTVKRPQLIALMEYVREDDIVIAHSLDRMARNVRDLINIIEGFLDRKITVQFINENLTFSATDNNPMSNLLMVMLGAIAQFERCLIRERQREGIEIAKKAGRYKGKPSNYTPEIITKIKQGLENTRKSKSKLALEIGISRESLYKYMKKMKEEGLCQMLPA